MERNAECSSIKSHRACPTFFPHLTETVHDETSRLLPGLLRINKKTKLQRSRFYMRPPHRFFPPRVRLCGEISVRDCAPGYSNKIRE